MSALCVCVQGKRAFKAHLACAKIIPLFHTHSQWVVLLRRFTSIDPLAENIPAVLCLLCYMASTLQEGTQCFNDRQLFSPLAIYWKGSISVACYSRFQSFGGKEAAFYLFKKNSFNIDLSYKHNWCMSYRCLLHTCKCNV